MFFFEVSEIDERERFERGAKAVFEKLPEGALAKVAEVLEKVPAGTSPQELQS